MKMTKAVFLDRDGVINKLVIKDGVGRAPYKLEDLEIFSGVIESCLQLKKAGYLIIVVTNQPDIARGWVSNESVELINQEIRKSVVLDDIIICFHTNADQCHCRKPAPGMLLEGAKKWQVDLNQSYMIGDRFSDIAAGEKAGCRTFLVGDGDIQGTYPSPTYKVSSLLEAVSVIIKLRGFDENIN